MTRLWLADVHANLPAFEAVLADAGQVDEVLFAGDVVGWGPHPAQCVDLFRSLQARAIVGNHDLAILARDPAVGVSPPPVNWDDWSRCQLSDDQIAYLSSLPLDMTVESCGQVVHLIHRSSVDRYLHPAMPDSMLEAYFRDVPGQVVYCGHSHRLIDRVVGGRRLVCLPPVGQPRDSDPRAGYAIEEGGVLRFQRVEYDVESMVSDLRQIGLGEGFCTRAERFLRTGFDPEWSREYGAEEQKRALKA